MDEKNIKTIKEPEGVKMLATEFAKAGADVTQTFTFYSTDDWIDTFEAEPVKKKKATVRLIRIMYLKNIHRLFVVPRNQLCCL